MEVVVGDRAIPYLLKGSRPGTIVFLPSLGTRASMWAVQMDHFSDRFTVVAPELGGYAPAAPGTTLQTLARDVESILDAVGSSWTHVVGISLGGMIAQEFALRCPDRVLSLTLVNTTGRYSAEAREAFRQRADTVERDGMGAIVETVLQRWFTDAFLQFSSVALTAVREMLLRCNFHSYAAVARAVSEVDTYDRLPRIEAPSLVIRAEGDTSLPEEASEELSARIPTARLARVPRLAHLFPVEDPAAFDSLFSPFLESAIRAHSSDEREEPAHAW
jgi:3-oxoadipate enol-lactonase